MKNIDIDEWLLDNNIDSEEEIIMNGKKVFLADVLEKYLKEQFAKKELSHTDCEQILFYGNLKSEKVNTDKSKKHLDYFLLNAFLLARESSRFDVDEAEKLFWERIKMIANHNYKVINCDSHKLTREDVEEDCRNIAN